MKKTLVGLAGLCAFGLFASAAQAGIVSSGSAINIIAPPTGTVVANTVALEAAGVVSVWLESSGTVGTARTFTDSGFSGGAANTGTRSSAANAVTSDNIGVGTGYESYLLFFDPPGTTGTLIANTGTSLEINFTGPIIGIEFSDTGLNGSDAAFGGAVTYSTQTFRGIEFSIVTANLETYTIFNNGRSIRIDSLYAANVSDSLRVIVLVPEPTTIALFGLGVLGLGVVVRRRRRRLPVAAK